MIFFDLDGTLLDHDSAAKAGATKFFKTFRSSFNEELEDFLVRWHDTTEKYFQGAGYQSSLWEERRMRMRDIFTSQLSDEEADSRFKIYLAVYESSWHLFPDCLPCLQALKLHKLGLITNGNGEQQRSKIKSLGLDAFLSTVVISREVNVAKPEKAIFELASSQAGVHIHECVYVGDRLEVDALASQQAGMKGIWLDRKGKSDGKENGIQVIQSLEELPRLLQN